MTSFKRLPSTVTPIHYSITLRPNLTSLTFSGSEDIEVRINSDTNEIVLNSLEIDITSASFTPQNGKKLTPLRIQSSDETETSCFTFSEPLTSGTGVLSIEFAGILNDKLKGFYRSKYTGADGQEERYAAVTHFEPTGARRAFPGWDEPAIRATFAITLEVPIDRTTLSNTDVVSEEVLEDNPRVKRVKYSTTPLMSTYLLAFIVGEFDFVESATTDGVRVRVYAPIGKASQGEFALEVGVKAIDYYNDYFGIRYPLPKLDMIAIADFAIGAMENWGATFAITLEVPIDRTTLSNTDVVSEEVLEEDPRVKRVKYSTTPLMSTYLLAFIVGEFDFVESATTDGVRVRVYAPVGKASQGEFALFVGVKAIDYYNDYFGIRYPLPKLDMIAIADFAIGAMENWGLVTYRETALLVDPLNTSAVRKQYIALVVAHELSHQWFGNLVTIEWWTHLWLKEGFASFMEYLCVDHLLPEYQIWMQYATDTYLSALELDGLHNSHPIEVPVGHPSEVNEIFDEISYSKGSAIIRMLHRYIGDEMFRKGMHSYLSRHSYKSAKTEDLWTALLESSNKPVRDVMSTWTLQKGYPVISVTSRRDKDSVILSLTQEKFCADGKLPANESTTRWLIPISVIRASDPNQIAVEVLMDSKTLDIEVPNVSTNEWLKLNASCVGVYRVNYSPELLSLLLPSIADKTLPPLDRLGLQSDVFALVQSGRTSTPEVLKLMDAFANED
ncbi:unnamed protein product, partial [Oppiella nova]